MLETVFVLWMFFDAGSRGGISVQSESGFLTKKECESHAESVRTLMLQPKYVRYICAPKLIRKG